MFMLAKTKLKETITKFPQNFTPMSLLKNLF